ncbi:MAG: O-antigen ligase family protein [Solirubrobacterales bacterium]|nr:O-antigen ligase family protein [Solirubrobacterales bacterium]
MPRPAAPGARGLAGALWWATLAIAAVLSFATFYAKGGLNLESMTSTEIALTLAAGLVSAGALLAGPRGRPLYGLGTLSLLIAFAGLTTLSVVWSVQPDSSWHDAGRMLAYTGLFGAALALARLAPERWPALLGGLVLAALVVCGYALLTKVFPAGLAPSNIYARLEEPFGYWNAIGLAAAMGAICCLWLGSRRSGHALLSALAYPAMGLMLLTLTLAYSRGALAAFAVGLVAWFCLVPLRLRGAAVLIVGALGAGALAAWDFSTHALSSEKVALADRVGAGHELGALTLAMLVALALVGLGIGFATSRRAPSLALRRRAGAVLLALIVLAVLAFAGALAHSQRGFGGSISHAFDALTNPNAKPPSNTPDRLTAVASVRARYWKEALQVFEAHPVLGSGAEGYATAHLRYRTETLSVRHAHGFVVQTLADLGLVGLALALALLIAWMLAAGRSTHPFNRRWSVWIPWQRSSGQTPGWRRIEQRELRRYPPERIGMLSLLCVVIVFGMHSLIDWTWYVPGNACVALLCAGWLAGRGPLRSVRAVELEPAPLSHVPDPESGRWARRAHSVGPLRGALAALAIVAALLAAFSEWQPQRSEEARQEALDLLADKPAAADAAARRAVSRDPLSAEAMFTLADVQSFSGDMRAARVTLQKAVRLQPSNPKTWLELGRFDLAANRAKPALSELKAAIYLNPESIAPEEITGPGAQREGIEIYNDYIQALRATTTAQAALKSARARRARGAAGARRAARRRSARSLSRSRSPRSGR